MPGLQVGKTEAEHGGGDLRPAYVSSYLSVQAFPELSRGFPEALTSGWLQGIMTVHQGVFDGPGGWGGWTWLSLVGEWAPPRALALVCCGPLHICMTSLGLGLPLRW